MAQPSNGNYWQSGYIFVADETGAEIPGSRKELSPKLTLGEYAALWRSLERQMGEGCMIKHRDD